MNSEKVMKVYMDNCMSSKGEGIKCSMMEVINHSTLKQFGHLQTMRENEMTAKTCLNQSTAEEGSLWVENVLHYLGRGRVGERKEWNVQKMKHKDMVT